MRKTIIFIFCLLISGFISGQGTGLQNEVENVVMKVKNKFAPDKRTAIFEVKVSESGSEINLTGKTNILKAKEELLKMCESIDAKIIEDIEVLPEVDLGDKVFGIVNLSVANIRSKPNHPAELATQALLGTPVKVLEYDDGFFRIQTPDEYISWVDGDGIQRVTKSELEDWINADKVMFLSEFGFVYTNASSSGGRVSDVVMGDILKLEGTEEDYCKVSFPDGRTGYVEKKFTINYSEWLKLIDPKQDNILSMAKMFMGTPYLWGGTSSKALDCSGFTKTVYFMNGVVLPRDASQQVHTGILVDTSEGFENLQPGDLLFFGRKAHDDKPERITHVALYIGNMEYIHASGRIKINSLDPEKENFSKYRLKSFVRAKRILTSINDNGIFTVDKHKFYKGEF